jgi:hypothetical protein
MVLAEQISDNVEVLRLDDPARVWRGGASESISAL